MKTPMRILMIAAFAWTSAAQTHIVDTLTLNDGVTPFSAGSKIYVLGPAGHSSVPSTSQTVTVGTAGAVDFSLVGCVGCTYRAAYALVNAAGKVTATWEERWAVPDSTSTLTITGLRIGGGAPYGRISPQQVDATGLAAGQLWVWDGTAWVPGAPGGGGGGSVLSVAGRTGAVVLGQSDITGLVSALAGKESALTFSSPLSRSGNTVSCPTCGTGGGGGTPGGTNGQVQVNSSGSFGGITIGGDCTLNAGTGALTCTKTSGSLFGTAATKDVGTTTGTVMAADDSRVVNLYGSQSANTVWASPNGTSGIPSFRSLAAGDIPALNYMPSISPGTPGQYVRANGSSWVGSAILAGDLPLPGTSTLGGVKAKTCSGTDRLSAIGTDGAPVCSVTGGSLPWTNPVDFGVSPSNTAAQNQTAFASMASAVNAGTTSAHIWLPDGVYNVLSTGGTALGTYNVPITFHCASPQATIINQTGTGKLIQMGPSGLVFQSSVTMWTPMYFENCQVTGGANASDGIYVPNYVVEVSVRDNYFYNWGNSSNYAVHSVGVTETKLLHNVWIRTDGVNGNFAWAENNPVVYTLMQAYQNNLVCAISTTNSDTVNTGCGVGFRSDSYLLARENIASGPNPIFLVGGYGTGAGNVGGKAISYAIEGNDLECYGGPCIVYGTVGGSSLEYTHNLYVRGNTVYTPTTFIGAANSFVGLTNAHITNNVLRVDVTSSPTLVSQNNQINQASNYMFGNTGPWGTLHTTGSNIAWNGSDTYLQDPLTTTGDLIYRSGSGTARLPASSGYLHWNGTSFAYDSPAASPAPRSCEVHLSGSASGGVLQAGDDTVAAAVCSNQYGVSATINNVYCWVDAGSAVTINPSIVGGSAVLSSPLTCGVGYASKTSGTLSITTQTSGQAFSVGLGGTLTSTHDLHVIFVRSF